MFLTKKILKENRNNGSRFLKANLNNFEPISKFNLFRCNFTKNRTIRYFGEEQEEKKEQDGFKEVDDSFFVDDEDDYIYKTPIVYSLNKDLLSLRKSIFYGYVFGGVNILFSSGFYYLNYPLIGFLSFAVGIIPIFRSRILKQRSSKVVSQIVLNENKKTVQIHFGVIREIVNVKINDIKPIKSIDMPDGGFIAYIDIKDDLDKEHDGLHVLVSQRLAYIPQMKLFSAIMTAKEDEVSKYELIRK